MARRTGRYATPTEGCVNGHALEDWVQMPSGRWACKLCRKAQHREYMKMVLATDKARYREKQNAYNRAYRAREKAKKEAMRAELEQLRAQQEERDGRS